MLAMTPRDSEQDVNDEHCDTAILGVEAAAQLAVMGAAHKAVDPAGHQDEPLAHWGGVLAVDQVFSAPNAAATVTEMAAVIASDEGWSMMSGAT